MTTGKQNPPDDIEFNWDADAPLAEGPDGDNAPGEFVFEAPPGELDYESGPEAPHDDRGAPDDGRDQFGDTQPDPEFPEDDGSYVPTDPGDESSVAAAPERSALSKYLFPGAVVGVAALLGGGGYLGWTMMNEEQPSSGGQYAQAPMPAAPTQAAPPRLPASVGAPALPPPALPVAQPGPPSLPGLPGVQQPSPRLPPATPTQFPSGAAQGQLPLSGLPGLPGLGQEPQPSASVAAPAPAAVPSGIETALVDLVGEMRKFTTGFQQLQGEVRSVRTDVVERLELTDGRIASIGQKVSGVETRVGGIEQRLSALETARTPQPRPAAAAAAAAAAAPSTETPTRGVNQRAAPPRPSRPAPAAAPRPQADAPVRVLTGWTLKGVSRTEVIVEDGRGNMVRAEIGVTQVPGVGVVRQVRRFQDTWELVTASGIIRP